MNHSSFTHRVDDYALRVVERDIIAGPLVRLACQRHIEDRRRSVTKAGHPRGFWFDEAAADHIITFFEKVLRLADTLDEDGDPIPFLLTPANTFIVGSMFGWKIAPSLGGWRRYRETYIEMGKGNAKTPLAAGVGLYGLTMDNEQAAEIYSAATGMEQAKLCWLDGVRMVKASPELDAIIHHSLNNLAYEPTMSFFRPVSAEKRGKSGPRPHMAIIDELHEAADGVIVNKLRAGAKRRKQPVFMEITNSGFDRTSICWQHHEHSRKLLQGIVDDDRWFAYVCGLDDGDDPLQDRACHPKANPNLGIVIQQEYLDRQVENAKNIPIETNAVLRLNFCVWTQSQSRYFDPVQWGACCVAVPDADLAGANCYAGFDSGQTDDFSALALLWALPDGRVVARMRYWLPRAAVEKYPERPYDQWQRAGRLEVTEGTVIYYDQIEDAISQDCRAAGVARLHMDKAFVGQMMQHLQDAGLPVVDQPQGYKLNEAIQRLSADVASGRLCTGDDPILRWMADNAVVRTGRMKELRLDKDASRDKIDGVVALTMAYEAMIRGESVQQPTGIQAWG